MNSFLLLTLLLLPVISGCANQAFFSPSNNDMPSKEVVWLDSLSGNKIAYRYYHPTNTSSMPSPDLRGTVVHFHGNSGQMEQTQEKVAWLTDYGFRVITFDYSGFGHSTGTATDKDAYLDAISILNYINQYNHQPLFVVATSTGSNIFLRAWADNPIEIDGIILDSPFTSYVKEAQFVLSQSPFGKLYDWFALVIMRDDYAAEQSLHRVPESHALVVHCEEDSVVPFEFGEALYQQLKGNKEFMAFDDCRHARAMTGDHPRYQHNIAQWLVNTEQYVRQNNREQVTQMIAYNE
ncbi:alpha/beta hydrolase [Photobacterium sp. GB-27]|uniref:alpha/beta hydrolase n=1 Tax=Photobacterium sp. GB-27 TaxID=2022109 RepID=UPI000D1613F2|nr:alpha/beta hydrolase [Photobacterium sp. GB-27]PSV33832.1 alpha/beta hydrolase [Photobacterium sp. GB-27]